MKGKCGLYKIECELKKSHMIPKFIFDYFKKTGGKYMRTYVKPNVRLQDGPTRFLLGEIAEQEFSKRERWFANKVFFPYQKDNKASLEYDENLAYFLISLLWRGLILQQEHPNVILDKRLNFLMDVKEDWRLFLSSSLYPRNFNDLNIFLTDRIQSHDTNSYNVDVYLSRTIDSTIIVNEDCSHVAVYVKFLRFIIWSVVKGKPSNGKNIKIEFNKGKIEIPQALTDDFFSSFIKNRIEVFDKSELPNENQQKKILAEIEKQEHKFWESDVGLAMANDYFIDKKKNE